MSKLMGMLLAVSGLAVLPVGMTGCEEEGPAERAGERLDEAGDDIEDAAEDAADDIEDAVD